MKNFRKLLVILLALSLAFSMVACGGEEEEGGANNDGKPTPENLVSGITPDQISNYVIKYSITETSFVEDEDGNYIVTDEGTYQQEVKTTNYVEVGYSGLFLRSDDGGESYMFDQSATSCFSIVSQSDNRGLLSSFAQFKGKEDQLKNLGTETVAGLETTHYQYKSGLFNYHMYVNDDYDITLKYESEGDMAKKMEVTELVFGAIDTDGGAYKFADFNSRIATPTPEPTPEAEPAA